MAVAAGLFAMGVRHFYALVSFALCTFVAVTVVIEFFKGAIAIRGKEGQNIFAAMVELTHRNTRRYGGYLVHMGVVFMFIGFTGKAFDLDKTVQVTKGEKRAAWALPAHDRRRRIRARTKTIRGIF